jgi:hypothetical protein
MEETEMSEYLPFWPKAAMIGYVNASGSPIDIFTRALPTNGFTEVVAQVECDGRVGGANSTITPTPQISNDGINWEDVTLGTAFPAIDPGDTYPMKDVRKITDVGAFMRFKVRLAISSGTDVLVGGTIMISGAGRS